MITNEMKAKIYSLYLKHEVQTPDGAGTLRSVHADGFIQAKPIGLQMEEYRCDECQLILKNISEITDEDLIEMSRIVGMSDEEISSMDNVTPETKIIWGMQMLEHGEMTMEQADFLRSKGYALPYMGINLFESGIAIPKQ